MRDEYRWILYGSEICPAFARGDRMKSDHARNTVGMLSSPRCGAKTRSGAACKSPAVSGKKRCRMHGGAFGSGAPRGNQNAFKHGRFTREAIEGRRRIFALMKALGVGLKAAATLDSMIKRKG